MRPRDVRPSNGFPAPVFELMRIFTSKLLNLMTRSAQISLELTESELRLVCRGVSRAYPHDAVRSVAVRTFPALAVTVIDFDTGDNVTVRGFTRADADRLTRFYAVWRKHESIQTVAGQVVALTQSSKQIPQSLASGLQQSCGALESVAEQAVDIALPIPTELSTAARAVLRFASQADSIVREHNDLAVQRALALNREWFDTLFSRPLNDRQREAVVADDDNVLVIAGAGTGKTTTVVARVAYLLHTRAARPEQVLLLAYTDKAREEMQTRLSSLLGVEMAVRTFHGLGYQILSQARDRKPSLSRLCEDRKAMEAWLAGAIDELWSDSSISRELIHLLAFNRYPCPDESHFNTRCAYLEHLRSQEIRTLRGELVKSREECMLADWLALNGIRYEYERPYAHDTASIQYRQYKPDFYLPDYDIYIEHFGIGRDGATAPYIDAQEYRRGMEWKRALHAAHGTLLVETFSYERSEGVLLSALESKLLAHGVKPNPMPVEHVRQQLQDHASRLVSLLESFLKLARGNLIDPDEVVRRARGVDRDSHRAELFARVYARVHSKYVAELGRSAEIDFDEMIAEAVAAVKEGRYQSAFTHVIVDEFQDISAGRATLLKTLLDQVQERRLFCVGDDWQSIFRFNGSDVGIMSRFAEHFGPARTVRLNQTYRINDRILEASSRFIMRNPEQIKKQLVADSVAGSPSIVLREGTESGGVQQMSKCLTEIAEREKGTACDVLVLCRYGHVRSACERAGKQLPPGVSVRFLTVHSAKGLEADYAIVADVVSGRFGFPTAIIDDPLLNILLTPLGDVSIPFAEERRLFYVALTRARKQVFVLTDSGNRSPFVEELNASEYSGLVTPLDAELPAARCVDCGGRLQRKTGRHGTHWGCVNYPLCESVAITCPECRSAPLVHCEGMFQCSSPACSATAHICPKCHIGALVKRSGKFGPFYGCTEFRPNGPSCDYTSNVP